MKNNIKKQILTAFLTVAISSVAMAQTNTFPATGNVGIGTTTPQSKLEINGGLSVSGINAINGINGFGNVIQINSPGSGAILFNPGLETQQMFGFHINGNMYWGGKSSYSMILSNAGDLNVIKSVTIGGSLKPGSRLSVKGKIAAQEVEVTTTNWPDYVFEDDYRLQPLSEVEQFVKVHKHLPEIPSAKQVEQDGVSLGEMNKLLLKKVEELTLHLIEKGKELKIEKELNRAQGERLQKVESEQKELKNMIEGLIHN